MIEINNAKQRKTLRKIFAKPIPNDILWTDIVSLFNYMGFTVEYGMGSRVRFVKNAYIHLCHRPHPGNQTQSITIKGIRNFLKEIGANP